MSLSYAHSISTDPIFQFLIAHTLIHFKMQEIYLHCFLLLIQRSVLTFLEMLPTISKTT